jgi:UDP-glucose 4-epimerase
MSRFLVTGGAGFIGSHLCEALVAAGHSVRVLDDLSTGHRRNLPSGVELLQGDVADPAVVDRAMADADGCFHLAAIASVEKGVTDWLGTHRANLTGAITVFDSIRRKGTRIPVVYASSAAVYGDAKTIPIAETEPCAPLSAYGADKLGCELHARVASHVHRIPAVGLRFFNVYGPRQDPKSPYSGVISIFTERIAAGRGVSIYGDGGQTRDFVYVADVVNALVAAMALRPDDAPVFNVCTGLATSVLGLAHLIADLCGGSAAITHAPSRAGEIRHSLGMPERAKAALNLPPHLPLRNGLGKVLAWLDGGGR